MELKIWIIYYLCVLKTPSSFSFEYYYFEDNFADDTSGIEEGEVPCSGSGSKEKHKLPSGLEDKSAQDLVKDLRAILRSIRTSAQQILNDVSDLQVELAADESQMVAEDKSSSTKEKEKDKENGISKDKDKESSKDKDKENSKDKDKDSSKDKDKSKDKSNIDGEIVMSEMGLPKIKVSFSGKPSPASSNVESSLVSNDMIRIWDDQINACKTLLESAKKSRSNEDADTEPFEKKLDNRLSLMKTVRSLKNFVKVSKDPGPSGEVLKSPVDTHPDLLDFEKPEKVGRAHISPWNEWLRA